MYWLHVARKDFADAVRSKMFWALSVVMLLLASVGMYVPQAVESEPSATDGVAVLTGVMTVVVPIIALVVGYMAIVGERQTGSLRMVLSLPLKRWEVLLGKLAGRTAVMVVPILLGFALAIPIVLFLYGSLPGSEYGEFVTTVVAVGAVFVAIAVGISGSVASRGRALALVVGIYLLFESFWELIPLGLYYAANGELPSEDVPTWMEAINRASPVQAVTAASEGLWNGISTSEPLVLQEWFAAIIVVLWIAIPLGIGYLRFERADIS